MHLIRILILLLLFGNECFSQDVSNLHSFRMDTIQLDKFASKKVMSLKYHSVSFLLDFAEFRQELQRLSTGHYHDEAIKQLLVKVDGEIAKGDTAHFDQATFDKISWVPFESFLCNQMQELKLLIIDANNRVQPSIIRVHGIMKGERYLVWGGWRYYLPLTSKCFLECTEWES